MSQLTITLDDNLLIAAQAFAQRKGQQLDALVAEWLQATVRASAPLAQSPQQFSPEVQELIGSLKLPEHFDYKAELGNALDERFGL